MSKSTGAKFWCNLAWVENYWNDTKRHNRERSDGTLPGMKNQFPRSLEVGCKIEHLRKYQQKCFDHMAALREIGRHGDFSGIPALMKKYKSHRRAELIQLGIASEEPKRSRSDWGSVQHARLATMMRTDDDDDDDDDV